MIDDDARIHPVEENLLVFANRVRTSGLDWVVDRSHLGVPAYSSDVPFPEFNLVIGADVSRGGGRKVANRVSDDFIARGSPWMWWTTPSYTTAELETVLHRRGLVLETVPGMYAALGQVFDGSHAFEIEQVSPDDFDFGTTLIAGFEIPDLVRAPMVGILGAFTEAEQIVMVARSQGRALGVGTGLVSGETLGIYNIATRPEDRGIGVGSAVTLALMREGRERGCSHAVLHTSPMGRRMYERQGFTVVCTTKQWTWLPPAEKTDP